MKKLAVLLIIAFAALGLSGCGSRVLETDREMLAAFLDSEGLPEGADVEILGRSHFDNALYLCVGVLNGAAIDDFYMARMSTRGDGWQLDGAEAMEPCGYNTAAGRARDDYWIVTTNPYAALLRVSPTGCASEMIIVSETPFFYSRTGNGDCEYQLYNAAGGSIIR